ncbi:DinB family protein [Dyadobacter tibetensis]|uniref:DinB family protein n=1 Tax=Dyadobacter tibetensis TaxID=1211851 RepID=UPI00046F9C87|nr:DinB family protein [Dyadobacter tibetensis]
MQAFFETLFLYNYQTNQALAKKYEDSPFKLSDNALKLYSHMLNAHHIWNRRILLKAADFGVWQLQPNTDIKNIDLTNYQESMMILAELDLNAEITYSNSKGQVFTRVISDILFHIINHSTYHRGQIATEFRKCGVDPLVTDYIYYKTY